jgi:hypothetical protein
MQAVLVVLIIPLIALNFLSGLAGGIWLAFRGEWALVAFGVIYMIIAPFFLGLALLPGIVFGGPAVLLANRKHPMLACILGIPAVAWTFIVMMVSCLWVFLPAVHNASQSVLPHVLWGYAMAVSPWMYMASKEQRVGDNSAAIPVFMTQLGTIAMSIAVLLNPEDASVGRLLFWFLPFTILGIAIQMFGVAVAAGAERRRF